VNNRESQIREAQDRLDREYSDLEAKEQVLMDALQRLKQDEKSLDRAIASTASSRQTVPKRTEQDNVAVQRLQQALFEGSSEDEDSDDE